MSLYKWISFSGGLLSPSLYGRADLSKYQSGLRNCKNWIVARQGGIVNRPGFKFVGEVADSLRNVRLIRFIFNAGQSYVLEFGNFTMRVIKDGAYITDLNLTVTGITNANPAVVSYTGTDPANGDEFAFSGFTNAFVQGRNFKVANVNAGANTFELDYLDGSNVDSTSWGTVDAGDADRIYTISTVYDDDDLATLQYAQSADVVTFTHPNYIPKNLARTSDTSWTFSDVETKPTIFQGSVLATASGAGAGVVHRYKVTYLSLDGKEESFPSYDVLGPLAYTTDAASNPVNVNLTAHGFSTGDDIYLSISSGVPELAKRIFRITRVDADNFTLDNENGAAYGAVTSGLLWRHSINIDYITLSTVNTVTLSWGAPSVGAQYYSIYKETITGTTASPEGSGIYGFIGLTRNLEFVDVGTPPDETDRPPTYRALFEIEDNYPSCVGYFQQRRIFANTNNNPETVYTSKTAQYNNFTTSTPIADDDAVTWTMAGRQVNEIRHIIDVGELIMFTSGGEWAVGGNDAGIILPGAVNPKQHSYNGASERLAPIVINGNALYVQARGSVVRDLGFEANIDGYRGNDLTIFANHLFDNYTLLDWDYQQTPHSIVWVVRDDGKLLGLTYIREHQIWAWHEHETDGLVENVCVIPEGNEDFLYLVIKRTIDGVDKKYVERMSTRLLNDIKDVTILDSFLTYDGRNTDDTHTMTLSGGTDWTYDEELLLTSSDSFFNITLDIGKQIHLTGPDGDIIRCTLIDDLGNSPTEFLCTPNRTVPADMRNVALSTWSLAVQSVSGLWHLENKDVSVFGDGFVVASPNNASYTVLTVENGSVSFDNHYGVIHVGLPITADVETLNLDTTQGETLADKNKLITEVNMFVQDTRGLWVGDRPPSDDDVDPLENLREVKIRDTEGYDESVDLKTGTVEVIINGNYSNNGRVFIRQVDAVPASILTIIPMGFIPYKGG